MDARSCMLARLCPDRYDKLLSVAEFNPVINLPEKKVGDYAIEYRVLPAGKRLSILAGGFVRFDTDITIQTLKQNEVLWMSNTPSEVQDMQSLVHWASGNVVVAGLGIGIVATLLSRMDRVKTITVVEISQEVIQLVGPHLGGNISVVNADFREWIKTQGESSFDYLVLDIWRNISLDELHDMLNLAHIAIQHVGKIDVAVWGADHLFYELVGDVSGWSSFSETAYKLENDGFVSLADHICDHWHDEDLECEEDPDDYIEDALREAFSQVYGVQV